MYSKALVSALAVVCLGIAVPDAHACSRVLWKAPSGDVLVGRTQDWTEKVDTTWRKFPRGEERSGHVEQNPLHWTSKYGSLSFIGYNLGTHEGVNEKGLAAHLLFLADEGSDFGDREASRPGLNIVMWAQYYLDNFATVDEAIKATADDHLQIVPVVLANGRKSLLHLVLGDASGDSAVLEYVHGKLEIHHSPKYQVVTNEPTYAKQLENLKQYRTFGGNKPLPGERTPMDRFVRASYYVRGLPTTPSTHEEGAAYVFSVMRNVSVPFGAADPDKPNVANTIFRSVQDLGGQRYYFESTYAPNVVWVDYGKLDYRAGSGEQQLAVEKNIFHLSGDVTDKLQPAEAFRFTGK